MERELTERERCDVLAFATGLPFPPAGGFKNLAGYLGDPSLFKLMRLPDAPGTPAAALPMAAACFNTLKCAGWMGSPTSRQRRGWQRRFCLPECSLFCSAKAYRWRLVSLLLPAPQAPAPAPVSHGGGGAEGDGEAAAHRDKRRVKGIR